jgi:hypothetical protein
MSGANHTLIETWNGSVWTIQAKPIAVLTGGLNAVSCTLLSACTAVGGYTNSSGTAFPLAETWNGNSWTVWSPSPAGAASGPLTDVSCTAPSACTAVSSYKTAAGNYAMSAARWDGTRWTLQTPAVPAGAGQTYLDGVSCVDATYCIAAGYYVTTGGAVMTLAETWDAGSWTIDTAPNQPSSPGSLTGIDCLAVDWCASVGYSGPSAGLWTTLAETYS